MSAIDGLANQTNPAANTAIMNAGVGGPGQLPTAALPYAPYRGDLVGFLADTIDHVAVGLTSPMILRCMQYIPTSGTAYLALDGHALALSNAIGWQQSVVTGKQTSNGAQSVLPDPAYFVGKSTPGYVKPYDWFWVVEEGPAVGIIAGTVASSASVMSNGSGLLTAATAANYPIGTTDGNFGNSVTTSGYGYGQYVVPSTNPTTPTFGSVSTTTGVGTAGTAIIYNAYAPLPTGVTANAFTGSGSIGSMMPSGGVDNASNFILVYVRPFLQMPEA